MTGLTKDDFRLQDNRRDRPIALFAPEGARLTDGGAVGSGTAGGGGPVQDHTMFLLDFRNTTYADQISAHDLLAGLLKRFQPRQLTAVYLLGRDSRLIWDFTADRDDLLVALANAKEDPFDEDQQASGPRVAS